MLLLAHHSFDKANGAEQVLGAVYHLAPVRFKPSGTAHLHAIVERAWYNSTRRQVGAIASQGLTRRLDEEPNQATFRWEPLPCPERAGDQGGQHPPSSRKRW